MISEGSCDTEHWSNDAENSALHHRNKLHFKILHDYILIFHNFTFFLYFDQINAALVSIRDLSKTKNLSAYCSALNISVHTEILYRQLNVCRNGL